MASSIASRLTVTRSSPAADSAGAYLGSRTPFVVIAISTSLNAIIEINSWRFLRSRGSPPVRRIFSTPRDTNIPAILSISSNVMISSRFMNGKSFPKTSLGMQYLHLKLHLSVTEILKSLRGLPNLSTGADVILRACKDSVMSLACARTC